MKLPLRYIIVLVLTALVCIFAYQAYWLVGMYRSQKQEMDVRIMGTLENAHFMEMQQRVERMREDNRGPHRQLTGAVAFSMDADDDVDEHVKVKKVKGGKIIQEVKTTITKKKKKPEGQNAELSMIMSGKLSTLVQQALFSKLNELSKPDVQVFDSALNARMRSDSLWLSSSKVKEIPHRIQFLRGKKILSQVTTKGYVPSPDAKQYQNVVCNEGEPNEEKYVLTLEPITMAVLGQMAGILATSLFIMLILAFVFWFLIHTMLKQKTLEEMKDDFTNNITHELKTPIAVVYAANDALLNYGMLSQPDKARQYLGVAQEQLQTLSGMVEQILSMSMERRKAMLLNFVDVPVKETIAALITQHQLKADKKVEFSLSVEPENLMVRADQMHFSNIVSNLIDNAIKYSGDSVRIEIKAQLSEASSHLKESSNKQREVLVSVSDNGIGIAHDKLPYIFDKFYRVTDGNKYTVKGYGLGLFYVKSLMEKMGGTVAVESELGKGTTFYLRFFER